MNLTLTRPKDPTPVGRRTAGELEKLRAEYERHAADLEELQRRFEDLGDRLGRLEEAARQAAAARPAPDDGAAAGDEQPLRVLIDAMIRGADRPADAPEQTPLDGVRSGRGRGRLLGRLAQGAGVAAALVLLAWLLIRLF